jgi:exosortase E/protease (VPEID-CTERM system)
MRDSQPLPILRWLLLAALLVFEIMAVTLTFDSAEVENDVGWWREVLWHSAMFLRLAVVISSAALLIAGKPIWTELRNASSEIRQASHWWRYLVAHVAIYAVFAWLTSIVLGGDIRLYTYPGLLVSAWMVASGLTLLSLLAAAIPPRVCWRLVKRCWLGFLAAIVVGAVLWGAAELSDQFWLPLGRSTFAAVQLILTPLMPHATFVGSKFEILCGDLDITIAPACSGYEGIGLIAAFLILYLWLFREHLRFPHALIILPIGILVSWVLNVLRLVALMLIGAYVSVGIAEGGFHSQAGWLSFNAVALGLVAVTHRLGWFSAKPAEVSSRPANPTAAYLVPCLVLIASVMITSAFNPPGFDYLYPLRVVAVCLALLCYTGDYAKLSWSWSWSAILIGTVVFLIWMALEPTPAEDANAQFAEHLWDMPSAGSIGWLIFRVVGSVATVPIAEELAFRGYLPRRIISARFEELPPGTFTWVSFLASSAIFGLEHGRWLAGMIAGMLFAIALYRRGRITDAILAHAVTNGLIAVYVLGTGSWYLWM